MEKTLTIDGKRYELVAIQRKTSGVYRGEGTYLRIGDPAIIEEHIRTHEKMRAMGYPVAAILGRGTYGDFAFYTETSLGDKTFRALFADDYARDGAVNDGRFDAYTALTAKILRAQITSADEARDAEGFAREVGVEVLCEELPSHANEIGARFERVLAHVGPMPYCLTHGDLNPANMYPDGIIDFEDAHTAPLGYDAVASISTIDWFPDSDEYEYFARYRFSEDQIRRYYESCDRELQGAGLSALSTLREDFEFCRAAWACKRMHQWPKIQKWRYEKFIATYL